MNSGFKFPMMLIFGKVNSVIKRILIVINVLGFRFIDKSRK